MLKELFLFRRYPSQSITGNEWIEPKTTRKHKHAHTNIVVCNQLLSHTPTHVPLEWVHFFSASKYMIGTQPFHFNSLNTLYRPKTWQYDQLPVLQHRTSSPLYKQYIYTKELTLWVRIQHRRGLLDTTLCDEVCQWLVTGRWFYLGIPVCSINKTDRHDIPAILLKVALNIIKQTVYI